MKKSWLMLIAGAAFLVPSSAQAMSLSFSWGPTRSCFDSKSPPMRVSGIPKGTKKLTFRMTDLDARSFYHGGGTVAYRGKGRFGYGAFRYKGPCPPTRHRYRFTVKAIGASGKVLAKASATRSFNK